MGSTQPVNPNEPREITKGPFSRPLRPPFASYLPLPAPPASRPPKTNPDLDVLLEQVAATLQLTVTQFERAERAYGAVTEWLAADGSPLAPFAPRMFPQGSAALLTTVRPIRRNDYDVDLACQVERTGWTAMQLYQVVWDRLASHGTYGPMLEAKDRCIRLNYEREFHLDIVPAEPAPLYGLPMGDLAVRIPDRTVADWTPSNPRGYARWFYSQAETARLAKAAREVTPLPAPRQTVGKNTVLATVVQLIKRFRDLAFADPGREDLAPRSIILTTLAAEVYDGEQSTARALYTVAAGVAARVRAAWPARVVVANPTNPAERFCDKFTPESYDAFVRFALDLEAAVAELVEVNGGLPDLRPPLDTLFGAEPVEKAITEFATNFRAAAEEGRLRASAAGLSVVGGATSEGSSADTATHGRRVVPTHRFFGEGPGPSVVPPLGGGELGELA